MKLTRHLLALVSLFAFGAAPVFAQKDDPNWTVYNPPRSEVI